MPTKLQPSQVVKDRNTGKLKTTHFYIITTRAKKSNES